jgi:hypothetical protein
VYGTAGEIGDAENISKSYFSRILRLALLAPDSVENILEGRTNQTLMLKELERPLPAGWESSVDACSAHARPKNNKRLVCEMPYMQLSGRDRQAWPLEAQALRNPFSISWSLLPRRRASVLRVRSAQYRSMQEPSSCQPWVS